MAYELSGMLASAVVKVARDKLVIALENLAAAATMPDDEKLKRHMEEVKQRMEAMAEVVRDAERRSRWDEEVREWLIRLEDAAYGVCDMVDELQANQWKPVTEGEAIPVASARKGRSTASMMNKAKENLHLLQQQLHSFAFRVDGNRGNVEQSVDDAYYERTAAFIDDEDSIIVGMDNTRSQIMQIISYEVRDSSPGLLIIPIVGLGGIGKTTLAKMVFSDTTTTTVIRDYARAWVTVGREFDLKKIGNCILSQLSSKGEHQDSSDVELIMKRLDKFLLGSGGNKLLVVLDDLWSDDSSDLEGLRRMLGAGKEDSKVIVMVTTRKQGE